MTLHIINSSSKIEEVALARRVTEESAILNLEFPLPPHDFLTKKSTKSQKKIKKVCREVLSIQKIILSLCYEDCEPTYKSSFIALDLLLVFGRVVGYNRFWHTGRLQGPMPSLSRLIR